MAAPVNKCCMLFTCPDPATRQHTTDALAEEKLATCMNILLGSKSIVKWLSPWQREAELLLMIKKCSDNYAALARQTRHKHLFNKVIKIIALPFLNESGKCLDWSNVANSGGIL